LKNFNDHLGDKLSDGLSSMKIFYFITFLVLVPLIVQRPNNFIGWIQYMSTAVLQACALPLLGYTTKKQGDIQATILKETHDTVMKELSLIKKQQAANTKLVKAQHKIISELREIISNSHENSNIIK
jgi:hypothetical protein